MKREIIYAKGSFVRLLAPYHDVTGKPVPPGAGPQAGDVLEVDDDSYCADHVYVVGEDGGDEFYLTVNFDDAWEAVVDGETAPAPAPSAYDQFNAMFDEDGRLRETPFPEIPEALLAILDRVVFQTARGFAVGLVEAGVVE